MSERDLHIPDGATAAVALARTTHLGVGAHPDDLEVIGLPAIGSCIESQDHWFTGLVCADGAGSPRSGALADLSDAELVEVRRTEQRRAAEVGRYAAVIQLGLTSTEVREQPEVTVDAIREALLATRPEVVVTHSPADGHDTHVAVALATVAALRTLDPGERPASVYGIEVWRDLDWLPPGDKVRFDVGAYVELGADLLGCYDSQIGGGKRYDLALEGRRRANATLFDPHAVDQEEAVVVGIDLSPLLDDDVDPIGYVLDRIATFAAEVADRMRRHAAG